MRILVFGAGVLGSYLAHMLIRGGNEVTVLARGKRAEQLKQDGLVIRHYFQRNTTVDEVKVIETLAPEDLYDLVFVVMKYNDFPAVLPILAKNRSTNLVLVGNNAGAHETRDVLEGMSVVKKEIVFGFQLNGGIREEGGRIICIRVGGQMLLGSLDGEVSFKSVLDQAFSRVKYKLTYHENMDAWLKSHVVPIVALNTVSYLHDGDMKKTSKDKKRLQQAIAVMDEGFQMLEKLGYAITPASQATFIRKHRRSTYYGLKLYHKLPFTKFIDGSFSEIKALYDTFEKLKLQLDIKTPNWDEYAQLAISKYLTNAKNEPGVGSL